MILIWWGVGLATTPIPEFKVTLYDRGKQIEVSSDDLRARAVVAGCEEQLRTADNILRLAVTPNIIRDIESKEVAVEIRYKEPKAFVIRFNKQTLHPLRLLIPLTGDFASGVTTIFHGTTQYGAGPYRNNKGTEAIRSLVEQLRGHATPNP